MRKKNLGLASRWLKRSAKTVLFEQLEERRLLTAMLFIDYGDNFPGGTLSTTQGAFQDVANDAVPGNRILGTTLADASGFNAGTQLDIVAQTFSATDRANMLAVVQRAYQPLDVEVVELTSAAQTTSDGRNVQAASSMADVINTLRAGNANSKDAYIFVATFISDPGGPNQVIRGPGGGGLSPGGTTLDTTDLSSASNAHDDVAVVYSGGGFSFNTMNNIAHEAGHNFGLQHSITTATPTAATNLFHQAEIMSYRNTNNTTSSVAFTRVPMIRGDGNTTGGDPVNYDDLAARTGDSTLYDQAATDPNIGRNPNFRFVSGTGAHDIITISCNAGNANVSVQAFADAGYTTAIEIPGPSGTTYSYSIPLDDDILVYGGDSNDRFIVDGDCGVDVMIDGMLGTDTLLVNGGGAAGATYTPDTSSPVGVDLVNSFGGSIAIGGSTISFLDFELGSRIEVDDVTTATVLASAGNDNLTADRSAGASRVSGTVNSGTGIVPLHLTNVTTLEVNVIGGVDVVTVDTSGGNPIPAGGIDVDGGTGTDTLVIQGATATYTPDPGAPNDPSRGSLSINGSTVDFSEMEFVTPVAPDITGISLSATSINEDDSVTLSGTFIDPGSLSTHTVTVNWGDGGPVTVQALTVGNRSFAIPHQYLDDNPMGTPFDPNTITVTITDNDALTDTDNSTTITVNNVDPVIDDIASDATFANKAKENEPVNILANFSDVGTLDTHTAVVDWGDGSPVEMVTVDPVSRTVTGSHPYSSGGIYTITVTLTDDDTGTTSDTTTAVVTGVGLNNGILYIIGSSEDDDVSVNQTGQGVVKVHASFIPEDFRSFDIADVDKIISYLCEGDDQVSISNRVVLPAIIHGGAGNDHLNAGGGPTVLLGDAGDDELVGQFGNNILIGGAGVDKLTGGKASDVLIGGYTEVDHDDTALMDAAMKWSSGADYVLRVAAVDAALIAVYDDGDEDTLTGSSSRDLFYDGVGDALTDAKPDETVVL